MKYLIAVLSDRIQAEAAYTSLEKAGVPLDQVSILGRGYKSADEFGLIDPNQPAQQQAQRLIAFSIPLGFIFGATFELLTGIRLFPWAGTVGGTVLGGLLGAAFGSIGGLLSGGSVGLVVGGGDALIYRNRLNAGKYLIVVQGSEQLSRQATEILRRYDPENLQGYLEPIN